MQEYINRKQNIKYFHFTLIIINWRKLLNFTIAIFKVMKCYSAHQNVEGAMKSIIQFLPSICFYDSLQE